MKLKPAKECDLDNWGGWRGEHRLQWRIGGLKSNRDIVEEFAVKCRCGVWWGWTYLMKAQDLMKRLAAKGCPRCKKSRRAG